MTITRSEVMRRAHTLWPAQSVPYEQWGAHQPDGYRPDCSGFVSMAWGLPTSENTESLVTRGIMREIDPNDLKIADAIGMCGPGTLGDNGHIQLFVAWLNQDPNDNHYYCLEQTPTQGPYYRLHDWPSGYKAYRYANIVDDALPIYADVLAGWHVDQWIRDLDSGYGPGAQAKARGVTPTWDSIWALNPGLSTNIDWRSADSGNSADNVFKADARYRIA